jgi:acetyl-CoA acetyltransferase
MQARYLPNTCKRLKQESPRAYQKEFGIAGREPDQLSIGPVLAVPGLLKVTCMWMHDIDVWLLNEAFVVHRSRRILLRPRLGFVTMWIGGGQGAAALFERAN